MAKLPKNVAEAAIIPSLREHLISQGKVRDTYAVPGYDDFLLLCASDRLSIFDFVLSVLVPFKGEVLTALTRFWLVDVIKDVVDHLACSEAPPYQNLVVDVAKQYPDLPVSSCLMVRKINVLPYELIFRAHIGGSVWGQYQKDGIVAGIKLRPGLTKWAKLNNALFTPSTKSADGHDVNVPAQQFFAEMGERGDAIVDMCHLAYQQAYDYAAARGIIILDTKFEGSWDCIGDEVLTPDSSRFTDIEGWRQALEKGGDPPFYDKEPVRTWGRTVLTPFHDMNGELIVGLKGLDPTNDDHLAFVENLEVPAEVIEAASQRYLDIFQRLTGVSLEEYQREQLLAKS